MFCKNCGKEIENAAQVCPFCGDVVQETETPEVTETPAAEQSAPQAVSFAEVAFSEEKDQAEPKKAKKKHRFPVAAVIAVVAAVAVVLPIVLNWSTIMGTMIKTFGSDSDYYKYVELKAFKSGADSVTDCYSLVTDALLGKDGKEEGSVQLVVGEGFDDLLDAFPVDELGVDLEEIVQTINDTKFSYVINSKGDTTSVDLGVDLGKDRLLSANVVMDMANSCLYLALPELSEGYVALDLTDALEGMEEAMASNPLYNTDMKQAMQKVLPSDKELNKILDRYLEIVVDNFDDVRAEENTLTIQEVSQKCTVLEVDITQELILAIAEEVLNEVKKDKDIKGILQDVQTFAEEDMDLDMEGEELYDLFLDAVDEMLDALDGASASDETLATLYTYVNGSHEIIGRRLEVMENEVFFYATVQKGKAIATELNVADQVIMEGSGTKKGDKVTGTYVIEVNGMEIVDLEVTDFDTKKAKDGYLNGTFRITPSDDVWDMLGSDAGSVVAILDPSLVIESTMSKNETKLGVYLYKDESVLVGLSFDNQSKGASKVRIPDAEDTIDVTDSDQLKEWAESLDVDKIPDILEDAGLDVFTDLFTGGMMSDSSTSVDAYYGF